MKKYGKTTVQRFVNLFGARLVYGELLKVGVKFHAAYAVRHRKTYFAVHIFFVHIGVQRHKSDELGMGFCLRNDIFIDVFNLFNCRCCRMNDKFRNSGKVSFLQ